MLALDGSVGKAHYDLYSLAVRGAFLLFVGGSLLFLARVLPWWPITNFPSASLFGQLIARIFVPTLPDLTSHF